MEVICIDDNYTEGQLSFFARNGISYPKLNEICQVVRVERFPRLKKTGLVVKPYDNQWFKSNEYGLDIQKEVSFDAKRFTDLLGNELNIKELNQLLKKLEKVK